MAETIALAIGYGMTESEIWTMSPGAIMAAVDARAARNLGDLRIIDTMIASCKVLYLSSKGITDIEREDLMILKPDSEPSQGFTPEEIWDRAFASLSEAGSG